MDHERTDHDDAATSVETPDGPAPDAGKAYDPEMTDTDEANIPEDSDADPDARGA
jgi:hypothetical protein